MSNLPDVVREAIEKCLINNLEAAMNVGMVAAAGLGQEAAPAGEEVEDAWAALNEFRGNNAPIGRILSHSNGPSHNPRNINF